MAKILIALHQFFPRFYTGTETLAQEVAEELTRRGHEVVILTAEPLLQGDNQPEFPELHKDTYAGLKVWRLVVPIPVNELERLDRESCDYKVVNLYEQLLAEETPDVVHVFHLMRLTMSFVETVKKQGIPVFFTTTDFWVLCPTYQLIRHDDSLCNKPDPVKCFTCLLSMYMQGMKKPPRKYLLARQFPRIAAILNKGMKNCHLLLNERIERHQKLMQMIDGVFWSNSFIRDMFHRNGLKCKTEEVVSFPVPEKAKALYELPTPLASTSLRVAFIGTLRPTKGPQVLINALKRIRKDLPVDVSIWGAPEFPPFLDELKELAAGDSRIKFRGTFQQEQFASVLSETDIVVIPSIWYENTPLTALSVMAARRVLIASDLGGLASLIENGKNGFLFQPGDAGELANILIRLAQDKGLVGRIIEEITPPLRIKDYVDRVLMTYFR